MLLHSCTSVITSIGMSHTQATEQQLAASASACTAAAERLQARLQRATDLQRNLTARLVLLAELRMLAPARMSAAERLARDVQLPSLEDQAAQLKAEVGDLARRAIKLVQRAPGPSPLQRPPPTGSQLSADVSTPPRYAADCVADCVADCAADCVAECDCVVLYLLCGCTNAGCFIMFAVNKHAFQTPISS